MHGFELHSNESVCRKSGRLWLEKVKIDAFLSYNKSNQIGEKSPDKNN